MGQGDGRHWGHDLGALAALGRAPWKSWSSTSTAEKGSRWDQLLS